MTSFLYKPPSDHKKFHFTLSLLFTHNLPLKFQFIRLDTTRLVFEIEVPNNIVFIYFFSNTSINNNKLFNHFFILIFPFCRGPVLIGNRLEEKFTGRGESPFLRWMDVKIRYDSIKISWRSSSDIFYLSFYLLFSVF